MEKEKIELSFEEVKKLEWSDALFENLDETIEELEEEKPAFRFFKNYEAEIIYNSDKAVNIGNQGVEGENWSEFLQEVKVVRDEAIEV